MTHAAITGWGACMPPAVLTNADLSTFLDTSDEWITSRTGMRERRISHVTAAELSTVAAARALACAGLAAADVDLIIYGGVSNDEACPNSSSGVQIMLGATHAAAIDLNTACTSFCYGLATATAMIRTGMVRNALVIGVELISRYMDWSNRNVAVLFGDGAAAVVLQATDHEEGLLGTVLGCDAEARGTLRVRGVGSAYAGLGVSLGDTIWDFDGQVIFKRAVRAMSEASARVLQQCGLSPETGRPGGAAPGQPADHRGRRQVRRHSDGQGDGDRAEVRQHECGDGAGCAGRGAGGRAGATGQHHPDSRHSAAG